MVFEAMGASRSRVLIVPMLDAVVQGAEDPPGLDFAGRKNRSWCERVTMTRSGAKPPHRSILRIFGPAASSLMVASGLGFVYWVVAARLYTPEQVGTSGATISLISGIGIASSGGLYAVLLRALAAHGDPRRLHLMTCAAVAAVAGVVGLVVGLFHVGHASLSFAWLWFALLSAAWALFTLQDAILISLRRTTVLFMSNVGFGVAKLVLLVAFAAAARGIVASWAIPLVIVVPIIAVLADRTIARLPSRAIDPFTVTTEHVATEYVSAIAVVMINSAVPVIVSSLRGGVFAGVVYVCWMLYIAADSLGTILSSVVVSSATEHDLSAARAVASARSAIPAIGGTLLAGIVFAPAILKIFGGNYSDAVGLLRLVLLAVLIRMAGNLGLAGLRVNRQFRRLAVAQMVSAVVTIVGVAIAAAHHSLAGIGWSAVAGALVLVVLAMKADVARAVVEQSRDRLAS